MTLRDGDPRAIGGYALIARLGSGGMGTVYSGRAASGRLVAVKLVHQQFADDPEFRIRFRQEVAAARRVSGAFTAAVVDADPEAERPWMATELVPGRTLGARVKAEGPLRGPALRVLALGLVEALRELHTTGVIHRDLKPDNVLLTDAGPRVIDFGISRAAGQQTLTSTGQILGTPPYMSPEQLSTPARVRASSDVFSLGSVLAFAATGRGPFDADSHYMTAYRVVSEAPDIRALTDSLRDVVGACLAKEAEARPGPDELLATLVKIPADDWETPVREGEEPGEDAVGLSETGTGSRDTAAGAAGAARAARVRPAESEAEGEAEGEPADAGLTSGGLKSGGPAGPATSGGGDAAGGAPGSAAAEGAGQSDGVANGSLAGGSEPPTGPVGEATAVRRRRSRRRSLLAAALAASLLAGGGVYLRFSADAAKDDPKAPRASAGPSGTPSGSARPPARPAVTGTLAPYVATDGGSPGGSRAYADPRARRPADWRAWNGGNDMGSCVYADSSLVCTAPAPEAGSDDTLQRFDAATGEHLWGQLLQDVVDGQSPLVAPGAVTGTHTVIVLGREGFTAHDLADGAPRWEFRTKERLRRPVLDADGSRVFAVDASGRVTALETRYGKVLWQQTVSGSEAGHPALRVAADRVYVQGRSQNPDTGVQSFVTALDGATGKKLPFGTPEDGTRFAMPGRCETRGLALAQDEFDGTVFLCNNEDGKGVLRGDPGRRRTMVVPHGGTTLSGPAAAGGRLYVMATTPAGAPTFMELDQQSGGAVWQAPLAEECADPERPRTANAVVVTDGLAYVRCRTSGVVIDLASRKQTGRFTVPGGVRTDPDGPSGFLVVGGIVFTPTSKGWSAVEPARV
ncbi:PQQ-binding-like beta-propeller repeat protein [Streptomyces sp. NPDC048370]|uniref:serine/threonine-protein kinase n=1 Tax=Streptomyces sp. NPDC048370 TaxID=3365540 RepID=UPI00371CC5AD